MRVKEYFRFVQWLCYRMFSNLNIMIFGFITIGVGATMGLISDVFSYKNLQHYMVIIAIAGFLILAIGALKQVVWDFGIIPLWNKFQKERHEVFDILKKDS